VATENLTEEEAKEQLEALLHESEQVYAAISRTFTSAHNIVGLFLPASIGLFVLGAKELHDIVGIDLLSLILAATFCIARLYADTLWTEFLAYWEYNFASLQPQIYSRTKQDRRNLGQSLLKGWPCAASFPMLVFHLMTFVFVAAMTIYGVLAYGAGPRMVILLICVVFLVAVASVSAILTGRRTKRVREAVVGSFTSKVKQVQPHTATQADGSAA
jgi:hypothetical protein